MRMIRYAYGTGSGPEEDAAGIPTDEQLAAIEKGPEGCPDGWTPPEWDEVD